MKLYVMSKEKAEKENNLTEPHVIISINFPEKPGESMDRELANPACNEYTKDVLFLRFSDVGRYGNPIPPPEELKEYPWCIPFNRDMAFQVIDFIKKHKVEHVIIHCLMGTSRSASMANAISSYYNGVPVKNFTVNYLVFDTMLEALKEREDDTTIEKT